MKTSEIFFGFAFDKVTMCLHTLSIIILIYPCHTFNYSYSLHYVRLVSQYLSISVYIYTLFIKYFFATIIP